MLDTKSYHFPTVLFCTLPQKLSNFRNDKLNIQVFIKNLCDFFRFTSFSMKGCLA